MFDHGWLLFNKLPKTDFGYFDSSISRCLAAKNELIIKSNQITNPSLGFDKEPQWIDISFDRIVYSIQLRYTAEVSHGTLSKHVWEMSITRKKRHFIHFTVSSRFFSLCLGNRAHLLKTTAPGHPYLKDLAPGAGVSLHHGLENIGPSTELYFVEGLN